MFPVNYCQPAGLALGPNQTFLAGCSVVYDTVGDRVVRRLTPTPPTRCR